MLSQHNHHKFGTITQVHLLCFMYPLAKSAYMYANTYSTENARKHKEQQANSMHNVLRRCSTHHH